MFFHNDIMYGKPNAFEYGTMHYRYLTDAEVAAIPWRDLRVGDTIGTQTSFVFPRTHLSNRFPQATSIRMTPLEDLWDAAFMGAHLRLGNASPLRLLDIQMLTEIIEEAFFS